MAGEGSKDHHLLSQWFLSGYQFLEATMSLGTFPSSLVESSPLDQNIAVHQQLHSFGRLGPTGTKTFENH